MDERIFLKMISNGEVDMSFLEFENMWDKVNSSKSIKRFRFSADNYVVDMEENLPKLLENQTLLEDLSIVPVEFKDFDNEKLKKAFSKHNNLRYLEVLMERKKIDKNIDKFIDSIVENRSITSLIIEQCSFGSTGIELLSSFLKSNSKLTTLSFKTCRFLENMHIIHDGLQNIKQFECDSCLFPKDYYISDLINKLTNVSELTLLFRILNGKLVFEALKDKINLKKIHITSSGSTYFNESFIEIFEKLPLKDLHLENIKLKSKSDIIESLKNKKSLEKLFLINLQIDVWNDIEEILTNNQQMKFFSIKETPVKGYMSNICNGFLYNKSLESIDLSSNDFQEEDFKMIFKNINFNPYLQSLYLVVTKLDDNSCKYIGDFLSKNSSLTHIDLSFNDITLGIKDLVEGLKYNKTLKRLILNNNKIGGNDAGKHIRDLLKNEYLEDLDVSYNELDNVDIEEIGHGMMINQTLKLLNFEGNKFTDRGFKAFLKLIFYNNTLQYSYYEKNERLSVLFEELLKRNRIKPNLKIYRLQNDIFFIFK